MASTANTAAPATVASGARWPVTRKTVRMMSAAHVPRAATQTPTTSSRLPRRYRLRYIPAIRPDAGHRTHTAIAIGIGKVAGDPGRREQAAKPDDNVVTELYGRSPNPLVNTDDTSLPGLHAATQRTVTHEIPVLVGFLNQRDCAGAEWTGIPPPRPLHYSACCGTCVK